MITSKNTLSVPLPARGACLFVTLLLVCWLGACKGPEDSEEPELETVDVVAPTIEIETADDPQAAPREEGLLGVLPEDFPTSFPIHLPSSLVDFGATDDGWLSVSLLSTDPRPQVEMELRDRLRRAGWQLQELSGGALAFRLGEQRGRLRVESGNPGTLYHYEYPPAHR